MESVLYKKGGIENAEGESKAVKSRCKKGGVYIAVKSVYIKVGVVAQNI